MGFKMLIDGVDRSTEADTGKSGGVSIDLVVNDRDRATVMLKHDLGFLPDRWVDVQLYEFDETTLLFGGLARNRHIEGVFPNSTLANCQLECTGYWAYLDWSFVTLSYTASVDLATVLTDILAQLPDTPLTVDPAQDTGVMLEPFSVTGVKASEVVRSVVGRCSPPRVARVLPGKTLIAFVPGASLTAPYSIATAAPNCQSFEWDDPDNEPANFVRLVVGPEGLTRLTQLWTADGVATSWVTDWVATNVEPLGVATVNEPANPDTFYCTVSKPGEGAMFEWDQATHTLSIGSYGSYFTSPPPSGTTIQFDYYPAFPQEVTATSGATPVREVRFAGATITERAVAQEEADARLATLEQEPRRARVISKQMGWAPGQALTVDLSSRFAVATFSIGSVNIRIANLATSGWWTYTFDADETTVYPGGDLDRWQEVLGSGSGSASTGSSTVFTSGGVSAADVMDPWLVLGLVETF